MWRLVPLLQLVTHVGCEALRPPTDVHVDSLLRWSPAHGTPPSGHGRTYTTQYLRFDTQWQNVPSCVQSQNTSCNVTATMKEADFGCVRLHVHAHENNLTSDSVEACSQQGDSCSPKVQLSSQPGTLTVNLSGNHRLVHDHGSAVRHLVSYAREGEPLKEYGYYSSSVAIKELKEGERYCVKVVFVYYRTPLGPPSCLKCEDIPQSEERAKLFAVTLGVVLLFMAVLVMLLLLYVFFFKSGDDVIKKWIRPPYQMSKCITEFPVQHQQAFTHSPNEEQWDHISHMEKIDGTEL